MGRIFIFCCFLSVFQISAQDLTFDWLNTVGDEYDDEARAITIDNQSNLISVGSFQGSAVFSSSDILTTSNDSNRDIFIQKTDLDGNLIWVKRLGGSDHEDAYDVAVDADDNIYIRGTYFGTVDFDMGSGTTELTSGITYTKTFVLKLNSNGDFQWVRDFNGIYIYNFHFGGENLELDQEGNVYISGVYNGEFDFDPTSGVHMLDSDGQDNAFLLKLDTDGNFEWVKEFVSDPSNNLYEYNISIGFKIDRNDDIVLTGYFCETIDIDPGPNVHTISTSNVLNRDTYILKLNSDGVFQWVKTVDIYYQSNYGRSVKVDYFNNIYLQGQFYSTIDFDPGTGVHNVSPMNSLWEGDAFLLKLDENGEFEWVNTYNHSYSFKTQLVFDECGSMYFASEFYDVAHFIDGTDTLSVFGDEDDNGYHYIAKIDENGNHQWVERFGGVSPETLHDMVLDSISNLYLTGFYNGDTNDFDPGIGVEDPTSYGWNDVFVLKLNQCGGCFLDNRVECDDFVWVDGNTYTSNNNTAMHTLSNINGCDSIVRLNLTMSEAIETYDIRTGCESYTWINGVTYTEDNNSATHMLQNIYGCDSLVHLNLSLGVPYVTVDSQEACSSFTWIDGQTYTEDENFATIVYTSQGGCDSIIRLNLDIMSIETEIEETDSFLSAVNTSAATYQWLDCNNNFAILPNETSSTLSQQIPGTFALEITQNGCVDTSACYSTSTASNIGVNELDELEIITMSMDNQQGLVYIHPSEVYLQNLRVYDVLGKLIEYRNINTNQDIEVQLPSQTGVYIIEVQSILGRKQFKVFNQ